MIRVAIIGMGIRGEMYSKGLIQHRDTELVGICDDNPSTLALTSNEYSVKGYIDYQCLIDEKKPNAVIIATPDFEHLEPALFAAARGVHLLIEKPLAKSSMEADLIVQAVRKNGLICQVAFENRWNPPFVQVKNAVERGDLGDISLVNGVLNDTIWVPTEMISWAEKTTVGWFLLPHILDLTLWISGKKPTKVFAVANKKVLPALGIHTYDSICTTITFEEDMQAIFENSWVLPESSPAIYDFHFSILGDKGAMKVNSQDQMIHQFTDKFTYPGSLFMDIHGRTCGFPLYMLDTFIECIKEGKEPLASVEDGYLVTSVVEAVHKSISKGQPIKI